MDTGILLIMLLLVLRFGWPVLVHWIAHRLSEREKAISAKRDLPPKAITNAEKLTTVRNGLNDLKERLNQP